MSDAMMFGIATMPYEMAMSDEMSRRQFYANTQRLAAALEAAREDAERIDALEAIVMESDERALLLHHGLHEPKDQGFCGLGLGNTGRSLRAAIDQARGKGGGEVGP